jgi:hypothetical protein
MLSITGHTPTDRAARYMKQLVSHLGRKLETSTQDASATVTMGDASAALTATASELTITVSAAEEALFRLMGVLQSHLERFGSADDLATTWDDADLAARYDVARAHAQAQREER